MENNFLLSIVMRVYNNQFCLRDCVESLVEQSGNFEIIIVDNGSTDESRKICEEFCQRYNDKIKLLQTNIQRESACYNLGIKNAKGKFVTFVNPNDKVSSNYVSSIENYIKNHNCDLSVFNYFVASTEKYNMRAKNLHIFDGEQDNPCDKIIDLFINKTKLTDILFNKVYKLEVIRNNNIKFLEENDKTDVFFFDMKYSSSCKNIFATNDVLYSYYFQKRINEDENIEKDLEHLDKLYFSLIDYIKKYKEEAQIEYLYKLDVVFLKKVVSIVEGNFAYNRKHLAEVLSKSEMVISLLQRSYTDLTSKNLKSRLKCLKRNKKVRHKLKIFESFIIDIYHKVHNYIYAERKQFKASKREKLIRKYSKKEIKNQVLFICFTGKQYSGNPRFISERLHELSPKTKIIWLFKQPRKFKKIVPSYIKIVKYSEENKIKYLATSKVWVDNNQLVCDGELLPKVKRKGHTFIETWHGDRGIKRSFYSLPNYHGKRFSIETDGICDYMLSGSVHTEKLDREMFHYKGDYFKIGCPRNDILINDHTNLASATRKALKIPENHKVLLYAPTFRENSGAPVETLDFKSLLKMLKSKYNCEWTIITKGHHRANGQKISDSAFVKDCSDYHDIADLLTITDLLITDFSSVAGDCVLANIVPILYIYDYDNYMKHDRGVLFDLKKSPFLIAKDQYELEKIIKNLTPEKIEENCKKILEFYGAYETGHATEDICSIILEKLGEKNKIR